MTKAEVITEILRKIEKRQEAQTSNAATMVEVDKEIVGQVLEDFFNVVKDKMAEGNNIYIRRFGSFVNKKRASKKGRDISRGEIIPIPEHFIPSFKPSKEFVEKIKGSDKVRLINEN
ncbi:MULTISPECIES: HU family DNA-binding protein [Flammeovirga]|nr:MULTISPECIES: HU family DNA-binding protein [Flammeovirga]MBB3701533.1 DNA-binding protein HU-beta [Flammeovirga yaeyamensis]